MNIHLSKLIEFYTLQMDWSIEVNYTYLNKVSSKRPLFNSCCQGSFKLRIMYHIWAQELSLLGGKIFKWASQLWRVNPNPIPEWRFLGQQGTRLLCNLKIFVFTKVRVKTLANIHEVLLTSFLCLGPNAVGWGSWILKREDWIKKTFIQVIKVVPETRWEVRGWGIRGE